MARLLFLLVILAVNFGPIDVYAQAGFRMSPMEQNTDRGGSNYNVFDLPRPDPALCQDACVRDPKCMAWTYVKPRTIQGPRPRCWLKQAVPPSASNLNCVSGYKLR